MSIRLLHAVVCWALVGCGGRSGWSSDANWSSRPEEQRRAWRETEALSERQEVKKAANKTSEVEASIGVRQDLSLGDLPAGEFCECLRVLVSQPRDARLAWVGGAPNVPDGMMAVAFEAESDACANRSIAGHAATAAGVTIEIEEVPVGRPVARGVLIAAPKAGASIQLVPASEGKPGLSTACDLSPKQP